MHRVATQETGLGARGKEGRVSLLKKKKTPKGIGGW